METRTRQLDASPAATGRRHRRPRLKAAGTATGTSNGPDAGATPAPPLRAVHRTAAEISGSFRARPPGVAALGARLARASGLVPPVRTPIASCAPSHATSGGS